MSYIIIKKIFNSNRNRSSSEEEWWVGLCWVVFFVLMLALFLSVMIGQDNWIDGLWLVVMCLFGIIFFSWLTYISYKEEKKKKKENANDDETKKKKRDDVNE